MQKSPTISVVIPAKNEEKTIAVCLRRLPAEITEVIVVDNNSTDNTAGVARSTGAIVLFEPRTANGIGYGFAHLRGLTNATGDFICGMDGDDTYPSEKIPQIVQFMQNKNLDFVSCARLPLKNTKAICLTRQLGIKILNWEVFLLYNKKVSDILSGMWIVRRDVLSKLNLAEGGWNFSPEIKLAALSHPDVNFAEYHINHFERDGGASKQKIWVTGFKHLLYIFKRRFSKDSAVFRQVKALLSSGIFCKGILSKNKPTSEKNPIKLLLVLPFFHPHPGGSQKYAEELFVHLKKAHPKISIDVLCYNTDRVAAFEEYRGLTIHRIPCFNILPGKFVLPNPIALAKKLYELSKNKYDFVNTHIRFFDTCWWVWAYAKLIKTKSIFTGHCASHPQHQNPIVRLTAKIVDLTIAKFSLRFYDIVTATNQSAAEFFEKTFKVKPGKIIYGSVDTNFFKPLQKVPRRIIPKTKVLLKPDDILITYVGRLIWSKGVSIFYEVAKNILTEFPENVYFVIAGPGELQDKLAKYIIENNLSQKIFLTGSLNSSEVQSLLSISDIFVYPSFHSEGFPQAVLEAGASGSLVIATNTGGTKEVVKNKETGLLVTPKDKKALKDAISWAIENPVERKRISQNMRRLLCKNFDWQIQSEKFFQLLQKHFGA